MDSIIQEEAKELAGWKTKAEVLSISHGLRTNVSTLSRGEENSFFAQYIR